MDTIIVKTRAQKAEAPVIRCGLLSMTFELIADDNFRLGTEMVLVYMDDDNKMPLQVHRNVILRSSKFFNNALSGAFKESSGRSAPACKRP